MTFSSFHPPRRILMGPGPSDVHPRVLEALSRPTIGHLDPAFLTLMDEIKAMLQYAFRTENAMTFVVSAPGSAGMECVLVNLVEPGDEVVVCRNGVFGGRMKEIVERCGGRCVTVDDPWGRAVDPQKVEEALRKHPGARLVAFVHAETSTGARSDARALAMIAREKGALVVADTVTSLGGIPLEVDAWGIDAAYSGSQKCLSCTPGLSPVTFSERALAKAAGRKTPVQSWFLDVNLVRAYWEGGTRRAYHHTAPINPLYGLHEALVILQEEGLEAAWDRHERIHRILRAGLERLGLEFFVPEKERLPHLNAVTVPEGVSESEVRARLLEEYGLEIGAGLGPLAGKIWRIGAMGRACHAANAALCLHALERVLKSLYRGAAP